MRKIFITFVIAVFVAGAVYAEEDVSSEKKVDINGSFVVRAWDVDSFSGDGKAWWTQRLRVGGEIGVAEGVSIHIRMDIGEGVWGLDYTPIDLANGGYLAARPGFYWTDTLVHVDRAFVAVDKGSWKLVAGQQYLGLGIGQVFDANATGIVYAFDYDPVTVALVYAKLDERYSKSDVEFDDDLDGYAINVAYAGEGYNTNVFYAMASDGSPLNVSPWAIGLSGSAILGKFNLKGELAFLGGEIYGEDSGVDLVDLSGTQLYFSADTAITSSVKAGAEVMYALASDDNEMQLTHLADWDTFTPMSMNTPFATTFSALPSADAFDPFAIGGGVVAATVFADFAVSDSLTTGCKIGYFTPEDDANMPGADLLAYNMWVKYQLAQNTSVSATYMVSSPDCDREDAFEDKEVFVAELAVNF